MVNNQPVIDVKAAPHLRTFAREPCSGLSTPASRASARGGVRRCGQARARLASKFDGIRFFAVFRRTSLIFARAVWTGHLQSGQRRGNTRAFCLINR